MVADIEVTRMTCGTCGHTFFISEDLANLRFESEEDIYCPLGHHHAYCRAGEKTEKATIEKLKAENADLKKQIISALHDAEQSEARRENSGQSPSPEEAAPAIQPEKISPGELPPIRSDARGRSICPYCNVRPWSVHIRRHLKRHHSVSDDALATIKFE